MIKNLSKRFVQATGLVVALFATDSLTAQSVSNLKWSQAGPVYASGRSRNMIVDKSDPTGNTLYVGSVTSGLFTSTTGGNQWSAVTSPAGIPPNISYLAQLQDNSLLIATGEGFLRPGPKSKALLGTGLYKLSGSTLTQVQTASVVGTEINKIAVNPNDAQKFALATNKGIYVTTNGGTSMNLITASNLTFTTNVYYGLDVKIDNSGILYLVVGSERSVAGSGPSKVLRSTDANFTSFTDVTPSNSLVFDQNYGRCEVAIAPTDNKVVYVACAGKYTGAPFSSNLTALYVNYDIVNTPTNWQVVLLGSTQNDAFGNGSGNIATGDIAQAMKVDPFNANNVFLNGYQSYYFQKTGTSGTGPVGTWTKLGNSLVSNIPLYLHENVHDLQFVTSGNAISRYYFITDAGIYRSVDNCLSFQPFYNGIITGQYNSVAVERYPLGVGGNSASATYTPYSGFVGGTNGSGVNYFSGNYPNVTKELNFVSGDVYAAEYSKLLPNAVMFSTSNGVIYQTADIRSTEPDIKKFLRQTSNQTVADFANTNYNLTGTPFKLWENYGQVNSIGTPDSAVFYNDTVRFQASIQTVANLTTQATFSFSANRPNRFAKIDSVVIRTATVNLPLTPSQVQTPFSASDKKDIFISIPSAYTTTSAAISGVNYFGPVNSASSSIVVNDNTKTDLITVTYTSPPFANKTTFSTSIDVAGYYRVFATVFYKYKAGDSVFVADNSISNNARVFKTILTNTNTSTALDNTGSLRWKLGATGFPFVLTALQPSSLTINSPSFTIINSFGQSQGQATPNFTVRPSTQSNYTVITTGSSFNYTALPLNYVITTSVPASQGTIAPSYTLLPGNITQTNPNFTISANTVTSSTTYTIAGSSGTNSSISFSTINTASYVLNPGNINQSSPVFNNLAVGSYTVVSLSGNTQAAPNRTATPSLPTQTVYTAGYNSPQFYSNNPRVKIATDISCKLAYAYGNGGNNGVYVSRNALNLNDPMSHVLVSRNNALTCDANGVSTNSTIAITGSVTLLEWGKFGRELYYATSDNKLYRVNNLFTIMDSTALCYGGKLHSGIFTFSNTIAPPTYTVTGSNTPNPRSPYRTTLLGTFTKPIRSIAITNNDNTMALTFDGSSNDTIVLLSSNNIRTSNFSNINFQNKTGSVNPVPPGTRINTYCSIFEKDDNKKLLVGTNDGLYGTNDVTSGTATWALASDGSTPLPRLQVFDIKQQVLNPWDCYNSGQIYLATGGRGVWTNRDFSKPFVVGVEDNSLGKAYETNLSIFPNPTSSNATILFNSKDGETARVAVLDLTGKAILSNNLGKLYSGETSFTLETANLPAGIYLVNIESDANVKRVAKLIVTK